MTVTLEREKQPAVDKDVYHESTGLRIAWVTLFFFLEQCEINRELLNKNPS